VNTLPPFVDGHSPSVADLAPAVSEARPQAREAFADGMKKVAKVIRERAR
jgi:hypothetical protein